VGGAGAGRGATIAGVVTGCEAGAGGICEAQLAARMNRVTVAERVMWRVMRRPRGRRVRG